MTDEQRVNFWAVCATCEAPLEAFLGVGVGDNGRAQLHTQRSSIRDHEVASPSCQGSLIVARGAQEASPRAYRNARSYIQLWGKKP